MNVSIEKQTGTEVTLTVTLSEADLSPTVRSVYNKLREGVSAKGFRPGKAPDNIIERELGIERVQAEITDAAAQKFYTQAVKEQDLQPIEAPRVQIKKFVPYTEFEFTATVEVLPEVKLPDYKKIKKSAKTVNISKQEIDDVVESLRSRMAERKELKRAAKSGDELVIDFKGTMAGKPVPGAEAKNQTILIGSGRFIPGFEQALTGTKPEEDKTFEVTFPKDYGEKSLAGKKVKFEATIHKVIELKKPKVDDKFAGEAGPFKTLDELRQDIEKQIKQEKVRTNQQQLQSEIVSEIVEKTKVEIPLGMLERQLESLTTDFERNLSRQGLSLEEYLKQQNLTREGIENELRPEAERRVKTSLVLTEVARQEKLEITPEELEVRLQLIAGQYQDPKVQEQLQTQEVRREIANQILAEKTVSKLVEYATS